jgi:hypothetical protein
MLAETFVASARTPRHYADLSREMKMRLFLAEDGTVEVPAEWDCPRCGFPAGQDKNKPPMPLKNEPYKTHLAYVKERRTEAEANKVLDIALKKLRGED